MRAFMHYLCTMYVYTYNVHIDILILTFFYTFGIYAGQMLDNIQKTAAS